MAKLLTKAVFKICRGGIRKSVKWPAVQSPVAMMPALRPVWTITKGSAPGSPFISAKADEAEGRAGAKAGWRVIVVDMGIF
jgi:hypothetical protein